MNFGPWESGIDPTERLARCRVMRCITVLLFGRDHPLVLALRSAERDEAALRMSEMVVTDMPSIPRRRLLSSYVAATR